MGNKTTWISMLTKETIMLSVGDLNPIPMIDPCCKSCKNKY